MIKDDDAEKIDEPCLHDQVNKSEAQWCPPGLTKTQKRRVQWLRYKEHHQEWRVKKKADEGKPLVNINMVFILPAEFEADYNSDEHEGKTAQLTLPPQQAIFEKPESTRH